MWQQVSEMLEAGLAALIPGTPVTDCAEAIDEVLGRHYSAREIAGMLRFRYGHGLGTSYEDPLITDCFPQSFGAVAPAGNRTLPDLAVRPGMLLELHPNFFLPETGGAAIGEMIVIRDSGAVCLLKHPSGFMEL